MNDASALTSEQIRAARYYAANRDHIRARQKLKSQTDPEFRARKIARSKQWALENKERVRALQADWKRKNAKRYREKSMVAGARRRAAEKGWDFNLTIEDVRIPDACPIFGKPFVFGLGSGKSDWSPSLDRIDNARGYVRGNVIVVSELANRIKNNATVAQLRKIADFYEALGGTSVP